MQSELRSKQGRGGGPSGARHGGGGTVVRRRRSRVGPRMRGAAAALRTDSCSGRSRSAGSRGGAHRQLDSACGARGGVRRRMVAGGRWGGPWVDFKKNQGLIR